MLVPKQNADRVCGLLMDIADMLVHKFIAILQQ